MNSSDKSINIGVNHSRHVDRSHCLLSHNLVKIDDKKRADVL